MYKCLSALVSRKHVSQDLVFVVLSFVGRRVVEAGAVGSSGLPFRAPVRAHVQLSYTPARLEALFKLSVVTILKHVCRSLQHFCGLWVLSPTRHLVRHVLHLVQDLVEILLCEHFQLSSECKKKLVDLDEGGCVSA